MSWVQTLLLAAISFVAGRLYEIESARRKKKSHKTNKIRSRREQYANRVRNMLEEWFAQLLSNSMHLQLQESSTKSKLRMGVVRLWKHPEEAPLPMLSIDFNLGGDLTKPFVLTCGNVLGGGVESFQDSESDVERLITYLNTRIGNYVRHSFQ